MTPKLIMFIRHAEKPGMPNDDAGVEPDGTQDDESLTIRGWQRAGALARFFSSRPELQPRVIFASDLGDGSKSKRPMQTVKPLADLLEQSEAVALVTTHLKDDLQPLMEDVLSREGPVLVAWEHKLIPALVGRLPNPPHVPHDWPDDRFDVVWLFDRTDTGWSFSQIPQLLLAGDRADPIA
jgi:broad specificity phosphatase PhoE